jgi:hypothetical protein
MISIERALNSIRGKNVEEVREFARNRILGTDIASFGSGHSTEPSEDVVIQLLRNPEFESEERNAVVEGWMDVYREVRKWLDDLDYVEDINKWKDVVVNLCRVVDIAEPPEFKKYVKRLITELLDEESCPGELLGAAVKAYMAYAQDEKSIRFWEDEILTNKDVAAYGFNALLDIDAGHPRIEEHLCELWRLQVEENWPVNTAFLLRRAARVRNETALIYRVLLKLKNKDYSLWERIEKELKQPWSQQWLEKLKGLEQSLSPKGSRKVFEEVITSQIKKWRQGYLMIPEVEFEHGIGADQSYYGYLKIKSGLFHTDWVYSIDRLVQGLERKKKIKSVDFEKESEEIEHVSKAG